MRKSSVSQRATGEKEVWREGVKGKGEEGKWEGQERGEEVILGNEKRDR
jgi:hypothetical protein